MRLKTVLATALMILSAQTARAVDYYVAPPNTVQSCTADGSQACPWVGIDAAIRSGKVVGGDRILLLDGDHGSFGFYMLAFSSNVTIQSLNASNAHVESIYVKDGSKNITFKNIGVWPSNPYATVNPLVSSYSTATNIVFDALDIRNGKDAGNYRNWPITEWQSRKTDGVNLSGPGNVLQNSTVTGNYMGAIISGKGSTMRNNLVDGFAGDAYRVLGDGGTVSGNTARNCVKIDDNHADGLQSWRDADGVMSDLVIESNKIFVWDNTPKPFALCDLQGIFLGDGPYANITVRNNLIVSNIYHGISIYGPNGATIVNNTVLHSSGAANTFPWIMVSGQSGSAAAQNVTVANNLAMAFSVTPSTTANIVAVNNSVVLDPANSFADWATFNFTPLASSGFVDTADALYAPGVDIAGGARPAGAGPDRGAYEAGAAPTTTTDGTTTTTTTDGTTTTTDGGTTSEPAKWGKFLKPPRKK